MRYLYNMAVIIAWICGITLAKGWWTLLAVLLPPYGWYLIAELILTRSGVL